MGIARLLRRTALAEIVRDGTLTLVLAAAVVGAVLAAGLAGGAAQLAGPLGTVVVLVAVAVLVAPTVDAVARVVGRSGSPLAPGCSARRRDAAAHELVLGAEPRLLTRPAARLAEPVRATYLALHRDAAALPPAARDRFRSLGAAQAARAHRAVEDGVRSGAATVLPVAERPLVLPAAGAVGRVWESTAADELAALGELAGTVRGLTTSADEPGSRVAARAELLER